MNGSVISMDNTSESKKHRRMKVESSMEPVESLKINVLQLKDNVVDWDSLEKIKDATNKALDVHKNIYDTKISDLSNGLKSILKDGIDGALKSLEVGLNNVDTKLLTMNNKILNLDNVAKTLEKKISDVISKISEGIARAELSCQQQLEAHKLQTNQLAQLVSIQADQIKSLESKLNALNDSVYKKGELLQVGESFNLPDQPIVSGDQGVYKDAPLALTVCGAAVLHNIGYTDKKGHQLILDPDTHRILVYNGK